MKKEKKVRLSLTFWCTAVLFAENLIAVGIASLSTSLISSILGESLHVSPELMVFLFSLALGVVLAFILNRFYLTPLKKINDRMTKVASGDFTTRIEDKVNVKEVDNIYKNFNVMVSELAAMETLQSDLVSNISHEFKTPITAIEGYSTLLKECKNKEEQDLFVEKIIFNAQRLSNLVGDILLLSKLENQKIQPKSNTFRLDEQIRHTIMAQEIKWVQKQIELDVDLDEVEFFGVENMLSHIWSNLLSNAIKFSYNEGKIKIRLTKEQSRILFSVEDNGCGIADDSLLHVFDKFYQADTEHKNEGCGLGLTLAKRIVELNDGEITVENLKDSGCRFTVVLPIKTNV